MIYLDYSATTPVCAAALSALTEACALCGNANSTHAAGIAARERIEADRAKLLRLLGLENYELIPTSGATEANNLALAGAFERFSPKGKTHIITTELEHPSVLSPIQALMKRGASLDFAPLGKNGIIDINALARLIRPDTLLVSIGAVNSETGIRQPIEAIGAMLKERFPHVLFHTDATQAIGKTNIDLQSADMISLSAHKFYCLKGIGALIKRRDVRLMPQNRGGGSTTIYRSGTPCGELIHAMACALEDTLSDFEAKASLIKAHNEYLRTKLAVFPDIRVNSPDNAVDHILNLSLLGHKAEELQSALSEKGICVSTRTARASCADFSRTVLLLTGDAERAKSSVRISLSHLTTREELDALLAAIKIYIEGKL